MRPDASPTITTSVMITNRAPSIEVASMRAIRSRRACSGDLNPLFIYLIANTSRRSSWRRSRHGDRWGRRRGRNP